MKFGPLPLFKIIGQLCPSKQYIEERLLQSGEQWDAYVDNESPEHKQVNTKRPGAGKLDASWK